MSTPSITDQLTKWYSRHDNVLVLINYMAEHTEASVGEVVYAVEKPWKHEDIWRECCERYDFCPECGAASGMHNDGHGCGVSA